MNSCIYEGKVNHRRHFPLRHEFNYKLFMMYVDLDELPTLFDQSWTWQVERRGLASFFRSDHYGDDSVPLATSIRELIKTSTGSDHDGPIRLLTHFRYFGFVMNPISIYYCFSATEELEFIVAEVSNTPWGETKCYVIDARQRNRGRVEARFQKRMHVSPFMDMNYDYEFCLGIPGKNLNVHIKNRRQAISTDAANASTEIAIAESKQNCNSDQLVRNKKKAAKQRPTDFDATLQLRQLPLSNRNLNSVLSRFPVMTLKVFASIYWQALRLWWRGTPTFRHPNKLQKT